MATSTIVMIIIKKKEEKKLTRESTSEFLPWALASSYFPDAAAFWLYIVYVIKFNIAELGFL